MSTTLNVLASLFVNQKSSLFGKEAEKIIIFAVTGWDTSSDSVVWVCGIDADTLGTSGERGFLFTKALHSYYLGSFLSGVVSNDPEPAKPYLADAPTGTGSGGGPTGVAAKVIFDAAEKMYGAMNATGT